MPHEELSSIVKNSSTIREILNHFGLNNKGGNYKTLQYRLNEEKIDFTHIQLGVDSNKGRKFPLHSISKEECLSVIFVKNSDWNRGSVKRYLKKYQLIPYQCGCGLKDIWNDNLLTLQLDHENGIDNDNRIDNLRWLCPNCHSQTQTFAGRSKK